MYCCLCTIVQVIHIFRRKVDCKYNKAISKFLRMNIISLYNKYKFSILKNRSKSSKLYKFYSIPPDNSNRHTSSKYRTVFIHV